VRGEYRRLPGRQFFSLGEIQSLWLGRDHVLLLNRTHFSENYKRFFFKDIQAVVSHRTSVGLIWNIILGLLAALTVLGAVGSRSVEGRAALAALFLVFLVPLLVNLFRGPTCATYLRTAVQTVRLRPLGRLKSLRRTMARLRPLIEEAQGRVTPEEIRDHNSGIYLGAAEYSAPKTTESSSAEVVHYHGRFHELLFYSLILLGTITILQLYYQSVWNLTVGLTAHTAVLVFSLGAMIRQRDSDIGNRLRWAVGLSLGYYALGIILAYIVFVVTFVRDPFLISNQGIFLKIAALTNPADSPVLLAFAAFGIIPSIALGVYGLLLLARFRRSATRAETGAR
jgi:hypothetical protein